MTLRRPPIAFRIGVLASGLWLQVVLPLWSPHPELLCRWGQIGKLRRPDSTGWWGGLRTIDGYGSHTRCCLTR